MDKQQKNLDRQSRTVGKKSKAHKSAEIMAREFDKGQKINPLNLRKLVMQKQHKFQMIVNALHNYLSSVGVPERLNNDNCNLAERIKLANSSSLVFLNNMKLEMIRSIFGTQTVRLKMHSNLTALTSNGAGLLTQAIPMSYNTLAGAGDATFVFDECKFLSPFEWVYYPISPLNTSTSNLGALAVGCIDYDDGTLFSNVFQPLSYDTSEIFYAGVTSDKAQAYDISAKWRGRLEGQPDLVWNTTNSYTTIVAWLKVYSITTPTAVSTNYGYFQNTNVIEFRQMN